MVGVLSSDNEVESCDVSPSRAWVVVLPKVFILLDISETLSMGERWVHTFSQSSPLRFGVRRSVGSLNSTGAGSGSICASLRLLVLGEHVRLVCLSICESGVVVLELLAGVFDPPVLLSTVVQ